MRCREATADTQRVGPVGEQLHVRKAAAERHEVPRAIHVRHCLEQSDRADREQRRDREECRRSPQRAPVALDERRDPEGEHERHEPANGPASAGVDQLVSDPGVVPDPACMECIEEEAARDVFVERRDCKDGRQHDERRQRRVQVRPPEPQGRHLVQNDRRVSMSSCMLSMSLLRSRGKARSMCSTLPRPERALPSRKPTPTSMSQPAGGAA